MASRDSYHEDEYQSSASDSEYQHALEVVFDPHNSHRRKSSLVASEHPAHLRQRGKNTECFVHAILDSQRRNREWMKAGLKDIAETLTGDAERGLSSDGTIEPKPLEDKEPVRDGLEMRKTLSEHLEPLAQLHGEVIERDKKVEAQLEPLALLHGEALMESDKKVEAQLGEETSPVHSRLLTKKQLSEMALGVRELSKRLASIRLKLKVKNVFLLTKAHDESLLEHTREVARWLLSPEREGRYTVYVEQNLRDNKKFNSKKLLEDLDKAYTAVDGANSGEKEVSKRLKYWTNEMCRSRPHTFDFVVTLGGDGTVLYASWLFQRIVPPVLSFSLGSLGFLTKFDYDDFRTTLTKSFVEGVTISLRLRFEGTVMRSQRLKKIKSESEMGLEDEGQERGELRDLVEELIGEEKGDERTHRPDGTYEILNDIVVDRGPNPTMSSTEIFGDDEHFTSVQADGVCVATPTGSTAYNLAAGGSLCHPENPVILVTAICAHTLSFRPIILPDTIVLRVGVPYDARTSSWASFDGRERIELMPGDYVTVSASRFPFANVMPQGRRSEDWISSISGKLGWNTRQRQKSYKEWTS